MHKPRGDMFSIRALANLNSRGRGPRAYYQYAGDSFHESIDNIRRQAGLARSIVVFCFAIQAVILLALSPLYVPEHAAAYLSVVVTAIFATAVLVLWLLLHVSLVRDEGGAVTPLNLANRVTLLRFLLIPSLVFLISGGRYTAALIVYLICTGSDVMDGFIARRRNERTQFGVVMDPLADIFSTVAVFGALLAQGFVPLWVFFLLMFRYGMLFVGSTILFFTHGPLKIRATVVGKIVGVLQASVAILIVGFGLSGISTGFNIERYLFLFLGLIFCSVIVSQLVLGVRVIHKGSVKIGS
ncbi:MAG: CDP-alcohol phosphatidyltransferase family protein [Candidatus Latescibacterota bacterium]